MTRTIPISILVAMLLVGVASPQSRLFLPSPNHPRLIQPTTLSPDQLGNLEGRVLQAYSQLPIEGAAVALGSDTAWTDDHGDYSLQDIPAGIYEVTASAFGYNSQNDSIEILSDSTSHLEFYLPQPLISVDVGGEPYGPPGSHIDYDFNISNLGDGILVYDIEAIFETPDPWFEVIPDSGAIEPLATEQIVVSIDVPDTAEVGEYYSADIIIHNNTITPTITIPITLYVTQSHVTHNQPAPLDFNLQQNYPNPFNPTTIIRFDIPHETQVEVSVFDLLGNNVAILVRQRMEAGSHTAIFDGAILPTGIYFYRIRTPLFSSTKKMILLK